MRPVIFIDTDDTTFAETLARFLTQWGFSPRRLGEVPETGARNQAGDVALLDIRDLTGDAFGLLDALRRRHPGIETILINRPDNIGASIAGMRAGAGDEVIVPLDTESLRTKIAEACRRRKLTKAGKNRKSLLARFSDAMAAAAFAQAGSYDDALDFLDNGAARRTMGTRTDKKKVKK